MPYLLITICSDRSGCTVGAVVQHVSYIFLRLLSSFLLALAAVVQSARAVAQHVYYSYLGIKQVSVSLNSRVGCPLGVQQAA